MKYLNRCHLSTSTTLPFYMDASHLSEQDVRDIFQYQWYPCLENDKYISMDIIYVIKTLRNVLFNETVFGTVVFSMKEANQVYNVLYTIYQMKPEMIMELCFQTNRMDVLLWCMKSNSTIWGLLLLSILQEDEMYCSSFFSHSNDTYLFQQIVTLTLQNHRLLSDFMELFIRKADTRLFKESVILLSPYVSSHEYQEIVRWMVKHQYYEKAFYTLHAFQDVYVKQYSVLAWCYLFNDIFQFSFVQHNLPRLRILQSSIKYPYLFTMVLWISQFLCSCSNKQSSILVTYYEQFQDHLLHLIILLPHSCTILKYWEHTFEHVSYLSWNPWINAVRWSHKDTLAYLYPVIMEKKLSWNRDSQLLMAAYQNPDYQVMKWIFKQPTLRTFIRTALSSLLTPLFFLRPTSELNVRKIRFLFHFFHQYYMVNVKSTLIDLLQYNAICIKDIIIDILKLPGCIPCPKKFKRFIFPFRNQGLLATEFPFPFYISLQTKADTLVCMYDDANYGLSIHSIEKELSVLRHASYEYRLQFLTFISRSSETADGMLTLYRQLQLLWDFKELRHNLSLYPIHIKDIRVFRFVVLYLKVPREFYRYHFQTLSTIHEFSSILRGYYALKRWIFRRYYRKIYSFKKSIHMEIRMKGDILQDYLMQMDVYARQQPMLPMLRTETFQSYVYNVQYITFSRSLRVYIHDGFYVCPKLSLPLFTIFFSRFVCTAYYDREDHLYWILPFDLTETRYRYLKQFQIEESSMDRLRGYLLSLPLSYRWSLLPFLPVSTISDLFVEKRLSQQFQTTYYVTRQYFIFNTFSQTYDDGPLREQTIHCIDYSIPSSPLREIELNLPYYQKCGKEYRLADNLIHSIDPEIYTMNDLMVDALANSLITDEIGRYHVLDIYHASNNFLGLPLTAFHYAISYADKFKKIHLVEKNIFYMREIRKMFASHNFMSFYLGDVSVPFTNFHQHGLSHSCHIGYQWGSFLSTSFQYILYSTLYSPVKALNWDNLRNCMQSETQLKIIYFNESFIKQWIIPEMKHMICRNNWYRVSFMDSASPRIVVCFSWISPEVQILYLILNMVDVIPSTFQIVDNKSLYFEKGCLLHRNRYGKNLMLFMKSIYVLTLMKSHS